MSANPTDAELKQRIKALENEVAQLRQAEASPRLSTSIFCDLFHHSPLGIALTSAETSQLIDVNTKFCQLTQYTREEAIGRSLKELGIYATNGPELINPERIECSAASSEYEMVLKAKDGTTFNGLIFTGCIQASDHNFVIHMLIDLTDRKKLEAQLKQSQKMEAVSALAGGIAHQFNNILSGITGNIELLVMEFPENQEIKKYSDRVLQSAHRMARLTTQLLAFARGGKYRPNTIPLHDLVENTIAMAKKTIDPRITIETQCNDELPTIQADFAQLQMVLSSLINNAAEAIDGAGRIRVSIQKESVTAEFAREHPGLKPGKYVCLIIEDNGKGMDSETRQRIFEPFFTTKFQGRGLGMAACYGIVKNHDGWIGVDSELKKGTQVKIYLPPMKASQERLDGRADRMVTDARSILIVDDEQEVLEINRSMFERMGYNVLVAMTGKEALRIARTYKNQIDLAIVDIGLPDIQGDRVYQQIRQIRPNLKIIISTGYAVEDIIQDLKIDAHGYLQKPFSLSTLESVLNEVLSGSAEKSPPHRVK